MYGACFFISSNEAQQPSRIYCARPSSRIWEVDFEGEVLRTHQFKLALACPPTKIHKSQDGDNDNLGSDNDPNDEMLDYQPQALNFAKLLKFKDFLLAHTELGIYIFDVRNSLVVLWCNQFERIVDCRVAHGEIWVFTQTGTLYSMQMHTLQNHAGCLVRQDKLLECAWIMRRNVRYFADKAREDFELGLLNEVKNFLMERHQYELLNDLSVIFDAIAQCEGNGDNNSSGGSSGTAERSSSLATGYQLPRPQSKENSPQGVYVLENSFCDNLKPPKGEKHFKDALLTVTGKFGKNIIKYKFNIFQEEQQKLVQDLIPAHERSLPFKDIKALYENDDEIVCRSRKSSSVHNTSHKLKVATTSQHITAEEKTIYNLYLICKSSKFSNTNFVERYRTLFDEYTAPELIRLLEKLTQVMIDHGDDPEQAQRHCYEMYFQYLNPELIWEMDNASRNYITEGFMLLNACDDIVRCDNCMFPLRFDNSCSFHELGSVLLRYYWSRNEQIKCFDVLTRVPALFDILARLYLAEYNMEKVLPIVLNYGQPELLIDLGKNFSLVSWARCFEQFVELQQGRLTCVNCECLTNVENVNRHFFYTWNCFLGILIEHMQAQDLLALIFKWSKYIPNDAIDREFYSRCLLKG